MMTPGILLLTTTLMHSANAGIQPLHCDRQALGERAEQIDQAAFDATAVRLFALRIGLCLMIDADMIDRTTAARILEHQRELSIDEDLIERDPWGDPGSAY